MPAQFLTGRPVPDERRFAGAHVVLGLEEREDASQVQGARGGSDGSIVAPARV